MTFPRGVVSVAVLTATLVVLASGCSDGTPGDWSKKAGSTPSTTTIELTLDKQPIELAGPTFKCYDHEGHLSVEAFDPADREATHFLMDYYRDNVALSIGIRGNPDLYSYEQGKSGQTATVRRDGNSVSVTGTIGESFDSSTPPKPFSIEADCAEFVDTPPDSSKVG